MLIDTASILFIFQWASKIIQVQELSHCIHDHFLTVTKRLKHTSGWPQQRQLFVRESVPQVTSCKPSTAIISCKTNWWKSPTRTSWRFRRSQHQPKILCSEYILMITVTVDDTFGARRKLPGTNPMPKQAHTAKHCQQNSTTQRGRKLCCLIPLTETLSP